MGISVPDCVKAVKTSSVNRNAGVVVTGYEGEVDSGYEAN